MRPGQEVHRVAVFDHHAFRQTGRTGGVDHVGQVRRSQFWHLRIRDGFVLPEPATQIDHRHRGISQHPKGRRLGQHHGWRAVFQHVGNPIRRIGRIQRHITTTRLEDRQQPDHHVEATLDTDRHPRIRPHALPTEVMRQSVGLLVQFAIAEALPTMQHRQRLRRTLHLFLEQPMNGLLQRILGVGGVERHQQLLALRFRQDRQAIQRGLGRLLQRLHQFFQGRVHVSADALRANLRRHQHRQAETVAQVVDVQCQRVIGTLFAIQGMDTLPCVRRLRRNRAGGAVSIVEQGAEQRQRRRYAAATLGQCQGGMFMAQQRGQSRMDGLDARPHTLLPHLNPQWQGVDEHPQGTLGIGAALHPPHQHSAEDYILLAGHLAQHLGPGQVHQAGNAYAQLTGLGPQAQVQGSLHRLPGLFNAVATALHILQAERQCRFVDIAEHLAEKHLMFFPAHTQACLGHIVAIGHGVSQLPDVAHQVRLHLVLHHFQRRVVERHVMEQQRRNQSMVGGILSIGQAHQGCLADIQAMVSRVEALLQLCHGITGGRIEVDRFNVQLRLAPDHLHRRLQAFPDHAGAQDVVTIDHPLQRLDERIEPFAVIEGKLRLQYIQIALFGREMMEEDAFLQRRQRIDILHVGRATRHRVHDAVDGLLIQFHQGQHRRCDPRATWQDAVVRHLDFAAATHRCRQRHQGRLAEQYAHVGAQTDLAHPPDQADSQQRVTAEFEEVIMTADALDLEQVLPDLRQDGFDFALGGFVAAGDDRIQVRRRQGLAVEFAVGSQWHGVETHISHRHHVFRQLRLQVAAQGFDVHRFRFGEVSHQALVTRYVFTGQHHGLFHGLVSGEFGFDLAQFDTEATDLHLVVVTAQVFDIAVRQVATQVAGLVHPGVGRGAERVLEETLGGQVIAIEITTSNTGTTDVDFPWDTQWHWLLMFIQQIELGVGDRFADVRSKTVFTSHRHPTGVSRGFRRAIEVAQAFDRGLFEQRFHQTALEGFTGHVHRVHALAQSTGFQQRLERRRHGVDQGDVVLAVLQFQHISHDFDAAAAGQRCKALVHGQVEVQRGREQRLRQGLRIERTMRPDQEIHRVAVFDHHAFRQTGRAGGVDHVGQMRRSQFWHLRIRDGLVLPEPATQIDYRHRSSGQQPEGRRLGQNHRWSTVLQHVGDPIRRIGRIQRHITPARLEDRQQTHDHVGTTLDADRHPRIRPHALPAQVMRQSVGPLVQLGIGQALPAMQHRQRLRRTLHLFLEQPMNGLLQRIIGVGGVERHQQLLALRLRQNRQIGQRRLRRTFQRLGQTHQRRFHIGTDPRRADPAHRLDGEAEIFTQIVHREHQWIVGPLFATEHLDTVPGRHRIGRSRRASVAVVEQGTEQRRGCEHAAATLSQSQGGVLVAKQRGQACMGRLDPGAHTLRTHAHPQRQGVDEHAQRAVGALAPLHPAHQHGAEHHIIASRHASQHLGPGQVDQARGTYAKLTRLGPQAQAQAAGERQCGFLDAHACTLHLLQAEWQGRLIDIAQHLAEEPFMGFSTHAQAHLCHVVAKRYRRRQCIGPAEQECLHLMLHQLQGCVVQRHVVEQQDRHPAAVGPIFSTDQAHQRRPAQVQTVVPGIETLVQLPLDIAFGRIEHQLLQGQSGFAPDHLHRLFQPLPHHRGT